MKRFYFLSTVSTVFGWLTTVFILLLFNCAQLNGAPKTDYLYKINLQMAKSRISQRIMSKLHYFYGKTYSEKTLQHIEQTIKDTLRLQGYFAPILSLNHQRHNDKITVNVTLKTGQPCRVTSIEASFPIPTDIMNYENKPCSQAFIRSYFSALTSYYQAKHYIEHTLEKAAYQLSNNLRTAIMTIDGELGPIIEYQFTIQPEQQPMNNMEDHEDIVTEIQALIKPSTVNPSFVKAKIKDFLLKKNYFVTVSESIIEDEDHRKKIYGFSIDLGDYIEVKYVKLTGAKLLQDHELSGYFQQKNLIGWPKKITPYQIEESIQELKKHYMS
ncbi:MAG: NUMOD3 domain-containing DNA-binding protein, partial [Proteobacteria bacterium]|nr:NUMOD3 domain-containing DNA-binding protein [Pseudomonadota bacterium]